MTNAFGVELHSELVRWAAAEGVSETVIAAVLLLHERSVDEIASKLRPDELEQLIKLVGRCPSSYPTGALDALKAGCPERPSASPRTKPAAEGQTGHTPRTDHPRRLEARMAVGVSSTAPMLVPWNAPTVPTPVAQPGSAPMAKKAANVSGWSMRPLAAA